MRIRAGYELVYVPSAHRNGAGAEYPPLPPRLAGRRIADTTTDCRLMVGMPLNVSALGPLGRRQTALER